ncbi:hypothetical protein NUW58_g4041 [Xylaria curta]|uniref:Uncharacterized protein n=1 Tax=Xylaria curta TaxID=42375 RepID=A0ACC1P9V8_9PEZI|nr:hypothetical protein NUW58_g4041 [Xylaria curta]
MSGDCIDLHNFETKGKDTHTDADDDTGGWLALHKRRHQRAFTPYLAAALSRAPRPRSATNALSRAQAEILRMALELEDDVSDVHSDPTPAAPALYPSASEVAEVAELDIVREVVSHPAGILVPKSSFLERCGKVLAKKRSFWRKKDEEK